MSDDWDILQLGACPPRGAIAAWVRGDRGHDWELGEHILTCPACALDRKKLEADADTSSAPDDVVHLDYGFGALPSDHAAEPARAPAPGTLWVLKLPPGASPLAPIHRVIVIYVDGESLLVAPLAGPGSYLPGDVLLSADESPLGSPLVLLSGVVAAIPAAALAAWSGEVAAAHVQQLRDRRSIPAEPDDEEVTASRSWLEGRFRDYASELRASFTKLDVEQCLDVIDQALDALENNDPRAAGVYLGQWREVLDPRGETSRARPYLDRFPKRPAFLEITQAVWEPRRSR